MKRFILFCLLSSIFIGCNLKGEQDNIRSQALRVASVEWRIEPPPSSQKLNPYYGKYVYVNGIHMISSSEVSDSALFKASDVVLAMTEYLPREVLFELTKRNTRVAIVGLNEQITDLPEFSNQANDTNYSWNAATKGGWGTINQPIVVCAEESLHCHRNHNNPNESNLVKHFAITILEIGILPLNPNFHSTLQHALEDARNRNLWQNTKASASFRDYWAEGVQCWFNGSFQSTPKDLSNGRVLKEYDPELLSIISEYFPLINLENNCK